MSSRIGDELAQAAAVLRAGAAAHHAVNEVMVGVALASRPSDYLARTADSDYVVLIEAPPSANVMEVRYGLFSISAVRTYRLDVEGRQVTGSFVAIRLFASATDQLDAFLQLIGFLLEDRASPVTGSTLISVLADFERLFARRRVATRAVVQGLWGEIWLIKNSGKIAEMVRGWHLTTKDTFDFASPQGTVEVKTHEGDRHVHRFAHRQLLGDARENWVVSLLVRRDAGGQTVLELLEEVLAPLTVSKSHRLRLLVLESLHGDLETSNDLRWVFTGLTTHCALLVDDVPRVSVPEGAGISDVHYIVDLTTPLIDRGQSLSRATEPMR